MFFQAKHPAVSADKLDTQLSTVTCSELRPLLQVCQPFGLVPYSLQTYQSSSRHYLVMGIKKEKTISILRRLETAIFHLKTLGILRKRETHHVRLRVLTYTFLFYVNVVITHVNYPRLFRGYYFEGFLFTTASALSNSIVFLIELQYIIFFYVIYRKFLLINDTFSQAKSFAHYKQLVIIHNRLCDLCYDVNEVFDQQILILITYIICNIYGVVVIFIEAMNGHVAITKQLNQHTFVLFQSADPDSHHVSFHVNHL
ncbi:hypothetical protein M8J76_006191 [Diaphorina citri]|nr:hypothetical protein M8J76_006191 [Diaphorina citri]